MVSKMHIKGNNHHGYFLGSSSLLLKMYILAFYSCKEDDTSLIYEHIIYVCRTVCRKRFSFNTCFWNQLIHTWIKIWISSFHLVFLLYEVSVFVFVERLCLLHVHVLALYEWYDVYLQFSIFTKKGFLVTIS